MPAVREFMAKQTFEWLNEKGEVIAHYVEGLVYTVREDNPRLAKMVDLWRGEGKVGEPEIPADGTGASSRAKGTATVT